MAIYTVTSGRVGASSDGDEGLTLTDAIQAAQATPESDAIVFAEGLSRVFVSEVTYGAGGGAVTIDGDTDGDGLPEVTVSVPQGAWGLRFDGGSTLATLRGLRFAGGELSGGHDGSGSVNGADGDDGRFATWEQQFLQGQFTRNWGEWGDDGLSGQDTAPVLVTGATVRMQRVIFENNRSVAASGGDGGDGGDGRSVGDAPDDELAQPGGNGGAGGFGGTGGDGGSAAGGFIAVSGRVALSDVLFGSALQAEAGDGGEGGRGGDGADGGSGGQGEDGDFITGRQPQDGGEGGPGGGGGAGGDGGTGGDAAPGFVAAAGVVEWETRGALLGGSAAVAGARGASARGGTGGDGGDGGPPGPPGFIQDPADPGPDGDEGADASESLGWNDDQRAGVAGPTAVVDGSEDVDVPGGAPSLVFAHGTRTQVKEGKALIFSIARMGDASREEVVRWRLNEEIADDVRGSTSGRVRFEEGQTTASVRVRTLKDGLSEGNAGVQFTINGQRLSDEAALGTRQVSASVEDRDQGTEGRDRLQGSSGVDVIEGLGAADRLFGRGSGDFLIAGDGRDRAWGGAGDDFVLGEGGKDRVFGGGGDDELYGGADDDALNGGRGRDVLSDGTGADVMTGGAGRDVFRLSTRDGSRDEILDFASGKDQMHFFGDGEIAFLGAQAFDGSAQAIRTVERKRGVLVQVDDDGDGEADATVLVRLRGESLQEGDFGLF